MRVLIVGVGIAGPTLAYWLIHYGIQATIIEKAPKLRTGGYIVDFWGLGFKIADWMGLLPEIMRKGYVVQEVRAVNDSGKRVAWFPAAAFFYGTGGHFVSLPRGELAATLYGSIENQVETIFGDSVAAIEQADDCVHVTFENGSQRDFDLVVGADGLHSRVRELVFGPEDRFEKYLGYEVAAFQAVGYRPRNQITYVMYTEVGQQVARFTMRDDRTMFLFLFAEDGTSHPSSNDIQTYKAILRERFANSGWETPRILDALDATEDLYYDRVSQIHMDAEPSSWSKGRVTLIGDAASCPSLLAGQGSALAMTAAYILAGELHNAGADYAKAFRRYQELFAPFVRAKQKAALRFGGFFVPKSKMGLFLRNQAMNLLRIPKLGGYLIAGDLQDNLDLPKY